MNIVFDEEVCNLVESIKKRNEFSDKDVFDLSELIRHPYKILIKKTGNIPEEFIKRVFKHLEEITRDETQPLIYFEFDKNVFDNYNKQDMSDFYKFFIERYIEGVGNTKLFKNNEFLRKVVDKYNKNFDSIYIPYCDFDPSTQHPPMIDEDLGRATMLLFGALYSDKYQSEPAFIVNISSVENKILDDGDIDRRDKILEKLLKPENEKELHDVGYTPMIASPLVERDPNTHRIIAIPNWSLLLWSKVKGKGPCKYGDYDIGFKHAARHMDRVEL